MDAFLWFKDLAMHLEDLSAGIVPSVLDCAARSNALPTGTWLARAEIVGRIEMLHAVGVRYKTAARRTILRYQLNVSVDEALSWSTEFKKGRVKNKRAMRRYQWFVGYIPELQRLKTLEDEDDIASVFEPDQYLGLVGSPIIQTVSNH